MIVATQNGSGLQSTKNAPLERTDYSQSVLESHLWIPASKFLRIPGKRIRAQLMESIFRLGDDHEPSAESVECLRSAVSFAEKLHAGSLIVDDIQDNSASRRGRPALHCKEGVPSAINIGNWMYFDALETLLEAPMAADSKIQFMKKVNRTILKCHEGQAIDLNVKVFETTAENLRQVALKITRLKTGSLMGLCCWMPAEISADNFVRERSEAFSDAGYSWGTALQMMNDLSELKSARGFSSRFEDIRLGRVTWPWVWAAKVLTPRAFDELQLEARRAALGEDRQRKLAMQLLEATQELGNRTILRLLGNGLRRLKIAGFSYRSLESLTRLLQKIEESYV